MINGTPIKIDIMTANPSSTKDCVAPSTNMPYNASKFPAKPKSSYNLAGINKKTRVKESAIVPTKKIRIDAKVKCIEFFS